MGWGELHLEEGVDGGGEAEGCAAGFGGEASGGGVVEAVDGGVVGVPVEDLGDVLVGEEVAAGVEVVAVGEVERPLGMGAGSGLG